MTRYLNSTCANRALLEELDLKLVATLDTHCHADHVTGAWLMQQATGSKIGISRRYGDMVKGADLLLDHGDTVPFGERSLEVRATPGHTDGCVTYVLDDQSIGFYGGLFADSGGWALRLPAGQRPHHVQVHYRANFHPARRLFSLTRP